LGCVEVYFCGFIVHAIDASNYMKVELRTIKCEQAIAMGRECEYGYGNVGNKNSAEK